jgi:hypothetical protein
MNQPRRLVTTGCSFTNYCWPTWPWFLASKFDNTYNYAQSGAGNEYIYHSIVDADSDLHLTKNDTVVICWSGYTRFDRFETTPGSFKFWKTKGDWSHWAEASLENEHLSDRGWTKKSINYMLATARYLHAKQIPFVYSSIYDLYTGISNLDESFLNDIRFIHEHCNFVFKEGLTTALHSRRTHINLTDGHPSVQEHSWIATAIANKLNLPLQAVAVDLSLLQLRFLELSKTREANQLFLTQLRETNSFDILTTSGSRLVTPTIERYSPDVLGQTINILDTYYANIL